MTKVSGFDKIRRTCLLKGREQEGRFGLLRKNVNVAKVLAPGQEGDGEEVDVSLVYDERISPRPPRKPEKQTEEAKVFPADKPLRRLCFVRGRGDDVKFHLIRKGAELCKVLEVGKEGTGEWVPQDQIYDEHTVPLPTKPRTVDRKPVRVCKLSTTGEQEYLLLRKTGKGARLIPVYEGNYGITVDPSLIVDEKVLNQAKKAKKNNGEQPAADQIQDGTVGNEQEQVVAAQEAAPQPAPVQAAPVQAAPVQAPVQPRPAQVPPQPRPAPVPPQAGAPRPAPVGAAPRPQARPAGR
jgi:hypothetical protein